MIDNRWRVIRVIVVALGVIGASLSLAAQPGAPVAIAIVRGDGVMIPIARLRGGVWRELTTWIREDLRLTAEAKALPRSGWTFYPRDGSRGRTLKLGELRKAMAECTSVEGFATDVQGQTGLPTKDPRPKLGLAVQGTARVEPIEEITGLPDSEVGGIRSLVARVVNAFETERTEATARAPFARPIPLDQRARQPVILRKLYRFRFDPLNIWHYFEAEKRYPDGSQSASGWLRLLGSQWKVTETRGGETSSFDPDEDYTNPLGVVRIGRGGVWVTEYHEPVDEFYELSEFHEPAPGHELEMRFALQVPGNHCLP